ncbi:MAG TPA: RteC domain-containing protein [Pedobacter sp.]|jgi:hypothetical protein
MEREFIKRLQEQLEQELESLGYEVSDPMFKFRASLKIITEALKKLRSFLDDNPFSNHEEEIQFFKVTKPNIYRWKIFYSELFTIEDNMPLRDVDKQIDYLEQELHFIVRFFHQYQFQYQYHKLNADELDAIYFVRGVELQSVLLPNVPELDPAFSTSCDYLFSKIKAYELLKEWVQERLTYLKKNPLSMENLIHGISGDMRWTGDAINLVELGYGLYYTGQLNNGTAKIGEIFRWLEEKLGVTMGIPAKRFAEIRSRKRLSRTNYIDEMKDAIANKLDKEDEYVPSRQNRMR